MNCPVCGCERALEFSSAIGARLYCTACFHGWRPEVPPYAYSTVAMCSLGAPDERLQSQITFFAPFLPEGGSILEIGCATGALAAATQATLNVGRYEAIELSPAMSEAEAKVDKLYREPLRDLLKAPSFAPQFDLVIISHVLEHLEQPKEELQAVGHVLKHGGFLFIEVPNRSGNINLPIDDNQSHIHFFSPSSLTRLLSAEGLETIATSTGDRLDARYADSLRILATPFSLPPTAPHLLSDHPLLTGADAIIVWGAGSLADEVLANFFDRGRIDFFIDSDPSKQGGNRLGHPVRGPEALTASPRTVLINSIDFADVIASDIARRCPGVNHRLVRIGDLMGG